MSRFFNRNLLTLEGKNMLYKIYAIDLRNIEVKLIDTKRKIFGTFKKTMLHQIICLIELH